MVWSYAIKEETIKTIECQRSNDYKTWFDTECAEVTVVKNEARSRKLMLRITALIKLTTVSVLKQGHLA